MIEHADAPAVDLEIFGECQALLINYEEILEREFGARYALHDTLAISLQFSRIREATSASALRSQLKPLPRDIRRYIEGFRSSLSAETLDDMAFSYKVFLVPMLGNHRSKDALAVEFVKYDPNDDEVEKAVALIKTKLVPALNVGWHKPTSVVRLVGEGVAPKRFTLPMHTAAWRRWQVRPASGAADKAACQHEFCVFDEVHGDYVYSTKWVDFLVREIHDDEVHASLRSSGDTNATDAPRTAGVVPSFLAVPGTQTGAC